MDSEYLPRGRPLALTLFALSLAACGWVDDGVDGNEPPVTEAADYTIAVDGTLNIPPEDGVLSGDLDPGGRGLTAHLLADPRHAARDNDGNLQFELRSDGSFYYKHDGGDSVSDEFTYYASDGIDKSDPTVVRIRIQQPPMATGDLYDASAGKTLTVGGDKGVLANDSDPNGDNLIVEAHTQPDAGTLELNGDGGFAFTPNPDKPRAARFAYTASDGELSSSAAEVLIRIRPEAGSFAVTTRQEKAIDIDVLEHASDPDGKVMASSLELIEIPQQGSAQINPDYTVTYTPPAGFTGDDTFRYTVTDDQGAVSLPGTVTIAVSENRAPILQKPIGRQDLNLGTAFTLGLGVYFEDPDGDPLLFSAEGLPSGLRLDRKTGVIEGTPKESGISEVSVAATDGHASTPTSFQIWVNAPPVLVTPIEDESVDLGDSYARDLAPYFSDPDGQPLSFRADGLPSGVSVDASAGLVNGIPSSAGRFQIVVTVSDGLAETSGSFVLKVNSAPRLAHSIPDQTAAKGYEFRLEVSDFFADDDGDALVFSDPGKTLPPGVSVSGGGTISGKPNQTGTFGVSITASDGISEATGGFNFVVTENQPPVAESACRATRQDRILSGALQASDADDDPLSFNLLSSPESEYGYLDLGGDGSFTYQSKPAESGAPRGIDQFRFRVEDQSGGSDEAVLSVLVRGRIMPLGDSITVGKTANGDPPIAERAGYRKPLYAALEDSKYRIDLAGSQAAEGSAFSGFDSDHEGHSGATVAQITFSEGVYEWLTANPSDVILLHIGTNDVNMECKPTAPQCDPGPFQDRLNSLLNKIDEWAADSNASVIVMLSKIIDFCPANPWVETFNDAVSGAANGRDNVHMVDHYAALAPETCDGTGDYADGLHPSAAGYEKMAERWFDALMQYKVLAGYACPE